MFIFIFLIGFVIEPGDLFDGYTIHLYYFENVIGI